MGHFKYKPTPGLMPSDVKIGIRLRRATVVKTAEDCDRKFHGWRIGFSPNPPVLSSEWAFSIYPDPDSKLCKGDCLEWVLVGVTPSEPPEDALPPDISISSASDCIGLLGSVKGQIQPKAIDWIAEFAATLGGIPYGGSAGFVISYPPPET